MHAFCFAYFYTQSEYFESLPETSIFIMLQVLLDFFFLKQ